MSAVGQERDQGVAHREPRALLTRLGAPLSCVALLAVLVDVRALVLAPLLSLAAYMTRPRPRARVVELALYLGVAAILALAAKFIVDPRSGLPTQVAVAATTLTVARMFVVTQIAPRGGDLALVIVAAAALGAPVQRFLPFGPAAALVVAAAALSREVAYFRRTERGAWLAALLFFTLSASTGVGAMKGVPRASFAMAGRFSRFLWSRPRTGFDESLLLGDAREILQSEKLVLRVEGAEIGYLRGKVYDSFDGSGWHGLTGQEAALPDLEAGATRVHVESLELSKVYFAPLGFIVPGVRPREDGILRGAPRTTWDLEDGHGGLLAPPNRDDMRYPRPLAGELRALTREWTAGARTDTEKLEAIEKHLRDGYRYTLSREPFQGNPLHDFLFVHRAGHCEFFATAFALLARAAGVPARVVGGYRVVERSPDGRTFLVREKHAHAWVEAYVGTWNTWDPTPPDALVAHPSSWERALSSLAEALDSATRPTSLAVLGGAAVLGTALVLLVRRARQRARARALSREVPLHPELARLEAFLAERGLERPRSQGLFAFAKRLDQIGDPLSAEAVRASAALRYGGIGTEAELSAKVNERLASGASSTIE